MERIKGSRTNLERNPWKPDQRWSKMSIPECFENHSRGVAREPGLWLSNDAFLEMEDVRCKVIVTPLFITRYTWALVVMLRWMFRSMRMHQHITTWIYKQQSWFSVNVFCFLSPDCSRRSILPYSNIEDKKPLLLIKRQQFKNLLHDVRCFDFSQRTRLISCIALFRS